MAKQRWFPVMKRGGGPELRRTQEHTMDNLKWSESEKRLSRRVYEAALEAELAEVMAEFKSKATAVRTPEETWDLEGYLAQRRREIDGKYDYRYSQLLFVFGRLVREGRVQIEQLEGFSEEKLSFIERIVSL